MCINNDRELGCRIRYLEMIYVDIRLKGEKFYLDKLGLEMLEGDGR